MQPIRPNFAQPTARAFSTGGGGFFDFLRKQKETDDKVTDEKKSEEVDKFNLDNIEVNF